MDDYPTHLAPHNTDEGRLGEPFNEWWQRTSEHFPNVPEQVAQDWLHRHWGNSPFGWLASADYQFESELWPTENLKNVRPRWCEFDEANTDCRKHGQHLIRTMSNSTGLSYNAAVYMREKSDFPVPILIADNRDGHIAKLDGLPIPATYIVIEGHRRFNIALHLVTAGSFVEKTPIWVMRHIGA